jgi:hypothetical protein
MKSRVDSYARLYDASRYNDVRKRRIFRCGDSKAIEVPPPL